MRKFLIFTLVLLLGLFVMQEASATISVVGVRNAFRARMGTDLRDFPDSVINELAKMASIIVSVHGLAAEMKKTAYLVPNQTQYTYTENDPVPDD